jgi:hypothetical protein
VPKGFYDRGSLERRRALVAAATAADPPMSVRAQRSGAVHSKRFYADPEFRAMVIRRLMIGTHRYLARRYGRPEPIFYDFEPVIHKDGSITAKEGSFRQLSEEELK